MAEKLLKETKDTQTKRKKTKKVAEEDDIYKIDLTLESPENEDDFKAKDLESEEKEEKTKAKRGRKSKNVVKVVEDDEEVDEIFGNINKWINEDEIEENLEKEKTEKKGRKKSLTKVEDGIKSSKTTAKKTTTKKTTTKATTKTRTKNKKTDETESIQTENEQQGEIKIHAENDTTELQLKHNEYKVELQKLEYNVYTQTSDNSYIIVRSPNLRIVSENVYLMIKKQEEDYEITTNQDFKINYVIDNLERKDNVVNFKLTNLVEIIANESGLIFEIDEEKVIENNLEDNHTLVISEEDGKVYLPYTKDEIKKLSEEVQKEPKVALDGGEDGLDFYRIIAEQAINYLKTGSFLCFEIGYNQKNDVIKIIEDEQNYKNTYCKKDLYGNDRIIITQVL